ncbi:MAG: c-type cytochrome [Candidatus Palauibacterales bacterium]|nr:c-type cytochrome [Candidatus Palauibacterales bacterium]MDP2528503.1 c-type cytochrome [Candidatus Palauibacterales bacterium]MDP2584028.1 c-type cytochrome [Candidatus Palauibacterales bacterium]
MRSLRVMLVPALVTGMMWTVPPERTVPPSGVTSLQGLPAGVTPDMVREGKRLFGGAGLCYSCHGPDGKGLPELGSNLTDGQWQHSDGSYKGIVGTIEKGVSAERSSTGIPMPPRAGADLSDDQVRAVSAYTWTLSHSGS